MIELKNNPAGNFFLLAGPCVIEGEEMAMRIAERIVTITEKLQIPYVFKGSYRKANRSRLDSFMGIGDEKALKILQKVHTTFGVPTVTDICGYSANSRLPLPADRPACSRRQNRKNHQHQERAVPLSACHALCG